MWQYAEEHIQNFLDYLNGCHQRIKWTIEEENERNLSFVDLNLCRKSFRISAGIHRKDSHSLKYSTFPSNRPRVEQLGIVKSMLHRAHELCDEGEPLSNEIELLSNAFIANGYHPKDIDRITSAYEHQKSNKNEEAEHTDVTLFAFHMSEAHQIYCKTTCKRRCQPYFQERENV